MDDNPFQSPQPQGINDAIPEGMDPRRFGRARQVPIVAVLMIVHGVVLCIIGVGYIVAMFFLTGQMMEQIEAQQQAAGQNPAMLPAMRWMFYGIYGLFSGIGLIAGLINIMAGARNYRYRGRTFGIVALIGGMASITFCWCLPLSVALLIYGLIIYLGQDAERAFRWQQARDQTGGT